MNGFLSLFSLQLVSLLAFSTPTIPKSEEEIIERLETNPKSEIAIEIKTLRKKLSENPTDLSVALLLAAKFRQEGKRRNDPRYNGYVQAVLAHWWNWEAPPEPVLLIRATLRQNEHQFDLSLRDLNQLLQRSPDNAQAFLTRAVVHQVMGNLKAAESDCRGLQKLTSVLVASACLSGVLGLTNKAEGSYLVLLQAMKGAGESLEVMAWANGILAEIAARLGKDKLAERHYKEGLAWDSEDAYLLTSFSDFLLRKQRAFEVINLLEQKTGADNLLLRLAMAQKQAQHPHLNQSIEMLSNRFSASKLRKNSIHLREEALFYLHLKSDPKRALELAKENWETQKEPIDAIVLLEAARAAQDVQSQRSLFEWVKSNGIMDPILNPPPVKAP